MFYLEMLSGTIYSLSTLTILLWYTSYIKVIVFLFVFFLVLLGIIEPVPVGQAAKDYLSRKVNPTLLKGLTELCKQKPSDPVVRKFSYLYN